MRQHRRWRETILELDLVASTARADDHAEPRRGARAHGAGTGRVSSRATSASSKHSASSSRIRVSASSISQRDERPPRCCSAGGLGEPDVQFWHEFDAGYAGRQPLSPELVG